MSQGGATSTSTQSIPGWLQSAGQGFLQQAQGVAQQPYTPYTQQRVADLSPIQQQGIQRLGDLGGGTGSMNAADAHLTETLQGGGMNPYASRSTNPGHNEYMGFGPQFSTVMNQGLSDIGRHYRQTTKPSLDAAAVLHGTLGGGDHQRLQGQTEEALAREMGRFSSGMLNDQYTRSSGLAESGLNRGLNAQQFDAQRQSQGYENERNRQMQAVGGAAGLGGAFGQSAMNGLNAGDVERRQNQSLLDSQYGDFREWRQYPEHQLGIFGNALGSLLGRAGGSTTTQGPGPDRVAQGIGGMQLASQFGNKGGGGSNLDGVNVWEH